MRRPLLCFALPCALGVFAACCLLPVRWQILCAAFVLLTGSIAAYLLKKHRGAITVVTLGFVLGILWLVGHTAAVLTPLEPLYETERTVTLEIADYPQVQKYGARCTARMDGVAGKVVYYGDESLLALSPGDTLTGTVKCRSALTVGSRESTYYISRGILLRLYPAGEMQIREGEDSLRYLPQRLKRMLCETMERSFGEDTRGFILALLTGERDALSEQSVTDLEESGLMHLTAVSGLHCGFLFALLSLLVGRGRWLSALVGYPVLVLYMLVVGCTPSVVRACVMIAFVIAAPLFERENDTPTSLGAAALVILLADPYAVTSVSFQLSFAAVAGLLMVSPRVNRALSGMFRRENRLLRKLWTAFSLSLSASIGALVFTAPISAYYFKTVALVSPLSNLLVLAVMPILFACALLGTLLGMIFPGAAFLTVLPELLARYVLWVAGICAKLPLHAVKMNSSAMVMWLLLVYTLFAVCWFSKDGRGKYLLAAALAVVSLRAARTLPIRLTQDDALTVVAVDVGQGAATLLHADDMTALIDCGTHYSLRGSGACVTDTMQLYGWEALDYLVLTHYHEDHAGGVDELLARVRVDTLLLPRAAEEDSALHDALFALAMRYGVTVRYVDAETLLPLGGAKLTIYPQLTIGETNEEGLTILGSVGDFDLLITGDMSASTERLLIEAYELADIEALFVGHHGSKHSTSEEFLREIMPEVGIISVGENSYGHPTNEMMKRMAFYGGELYRTDQQGNIVIRVHK